MRGEPGTGRPARRDRRATGGSGRSPSASGPAAFISQVATVTAMQRRARSSSPASCTVVARRSGGSPTRAPAVAGQQGVAGLGDQQQAPAIAAPQQCGQQRRAGERRTSSIASSRKNAGKTTSAPSRVQQLGVGLEPGRPRRCRVTQHTHCGAVAPTSRGASNRPPPAVASTNERGRPAPGPAAARRSRPPLQAVVEGDAHHDVAGVDQDRRRATAATALPERQRRQQRELRRTR